VASKHEPENEPKSGQSSWWHSPRRRWQKRLLPQVVARYACSGMASCRLCWRASLSTEPPKRRVS